MIRIIGVGLCCLGLMLGCGGQTGPAYSNSPEDDPSSNDTMESLEPTGEGVPEGDPEPGE